MRTPDALAALAAALLLAAPLGAQGLPVTKDRPTAEGRRRTAAPAASLSRRLGDGERAAMARLPEGEGRQVALGGCVTCHSASLLVVQRKDSAGWDRTVTQMMGWGATVPAERKAVLVAYLAEHFPARGPAPTPAPAPASRP